MEAEDITLVNPKTSKYDAGQKVILQTGKAGTIIGVDSINNEYLLMTTDNKQITVKSHDIDKIEPSKYQEYQESGVNPDDDTKLAIQGTPFDIDGDK